jgi:hypothetical protein
MYEFAQDLLTIQEGWQSVSFEARLSTKELLLFDSLPFSPKRFLFSNLLIGLAGSEKSFLYLIMM